jgi:hypothetical protein
MSLNNVPREEELIIRTDDNRVRLNLNPFIFYMEPNHIREHMMPIIRRIINNNNIIYNRFLQIFGDDFNNIFFYDYNLNREELAQWLIEHPPIPNTLENIDIHLRIRDNNVITLFARDIDGNRILQEDGEYEVGIMDEYPELFYVIETYMREEYRERYQRRLFDYIPKNI